MNDATRTVEIHALLFELECEPPRSRTLVVWLDDNGNGKHTYHAHPSKTLLDVEAGHVIVNHRQQFVVKAVSLYRTSPPIIGKENPAVKSGRHFMETGTTW